jgi:hypothetical protein
MNNVPRWFTLVAGIALLWNVAGLLAVMADLRLTSADIAALPAEQQALYAARPLWSVIASVVAVLGGTVGCLALLIRKKWAVALLYASLVGVVFQDIGLFIVAGQAKMGNAVPFVLQSVVFVVAVGLIVLARRAQGKLWIS